MEIIFQTKEQSNQEQKETFLKLSKTDRFYSFLRSMERFAAFPMKKKLEKNKNNFIIEIKR